VKVSAKITKSANFIFRIVLAALVYIFLYLELKQNREQFQVEALLSSGFANLKYIFFALILMPINWLIESVKWQFLINKIEKVKIWNAVKAVYAGTAISIFTPNRIGDYLGRIFILKKGDRIDGTIATIVGNLSQLLVTIIMGGLSMIYYSNSLSQKFLNDPYFESIGIAMVALILVLLLLLYFNFPLIEKRFYTRLKMDRIPIVKHLNLLSEYKRNDLFKVLIYSFSRYLIYSLQFYLLLSAFDIQLPFIKGMMMIFLIFFSLTVIPSIAVVELGLRALVTIGIFDILGNNSVSELAMVSATSALWLINIALASLIGGLFIFQLKFFRKNQPEAAS
jgi:hypothetical protein